MTLSRQLFALVALMFVLAFSGTFFINLQSTRQYLTEQLQTQAEDVANSLGLSLSQPLGNDDRELAQRMVDALFDRGYYRQITVTATDRSTLIDRRLEVVATDVPDWFIGLVPLKTPPGNALIMSGWRQLGELTVVNHPGYAYEDLWRTAVNSFWWSLGSFGVILIFTFALLRALLKPLRAVESQAGAIMERRFEQLSELPRARELRVLVQAMNKMSAKVESMLEEATQAAERLRVQAFTDEATGLGNRRSLMAQLENITSIRGQESFGAVLMIRAGGLDEIRETAGFVARDEVVIEIAERLTTLKADGQAHAARLSSDEFVVVTPKVLEDDVADICDELDRSLASLKQGVSGDLDINIGAASFGAGESGSGILGKADLALKGAQESTSERWRVFGGDTGERSFAVGGAMRWKSFIEKAIAERAVELWRQPVKSANLDRVLHYEVLTRIVGEDGKPIPAGVFVPLVARFGLSQALDRMVIELALDELDGRAKSDDLHYAVNLSAESIGDPAFRNWLYGVLKTRAASATRITFETPDYVTQVALEPVRELSNKLGGLGAGFALDHFGTTTASFRRLRTLSTDYVKVDGSYTINIETETDDQFFMRSLADITHGLDVVIIAEFVETEAQRKLLEGIGIDGVQGYLVGRPEAGEERG